MYRITVTAVFTALVFSLPVSAQNTDKDKNLDVRSPIGDLHLGKDADAQKAGLPLYPGARPQRKDNDDGDAVNLALATEKIGMNLIVAKYETNDPQEKVLAFYREKMKKYGKVLECHSTDDKSGFHSDDDKDDKKENSQPLKCEGDNSGPVRELKVGTQDNQRIVAIEDPKSGKATTFVIIYLRKHEKGDI
jgi:hypothetical protein